MACLLARPPTCPTAPISSTSSEGPAMTPPKLSVDNEGRVHGPNVTWNSPFPCRHGYPHRMQVPSKVLGAVMHTMDGTLPGTVAWFNDPASGVSAHFGVDENGKVVQFGPINGWASEAQGAGNATYYSIEFSDHRDDTIPLTPAQINAGAQLLELVSRDSVGRFPLQISDHPGTEGFGWHGMGAPAWGHAACPGDTRKAQRQKIIDTARTIRAGGRELAVYPCEGYKSLEGLAAQLHSAPSTLLRLTAEHSPGRKFYSGIAGYLNEVFAADRENVPKGTVVYYPSDPTPKPL